jgi:hypothetical protein
MIDEWNKEQLERHRHFLSSRASHHLERQPGWERNFAAGATLYRDAAAVAFLLDDFDDGRMFLFRSGHLFLMLGYAGGLQLLYIAGELDAEKEEARELDQADRFIDAFSKTFIFHQHAEQPIDSPDGEPAINSDSFRPGQLLRAYQGLTGRVLRDASTSLIRGPMREALSVNSTMPIGSSQMPVSVYLAAFDWLCDRERNAKQDELKGYMDPMFRSIALRRQESLHAARRDRFHWTALPRPAELIDFDLLALLLAGIRRRTIPKFVEQAFLERDPVTALPYALAKSLA